MSIEGNFKQISPSLLEKLKEYPDFIRIFIYAETLPDSTYWEQFNRPDIPADILQELDSIKNMVWEELERLEVVKPEDIFDLILECYDEFVKYYQEAAEKEKAMLIYFS